MISFAFSKKGEAFVAFHMQYHTVIPPSSLIWLPKLYTVSLFVGILPTLLLVCDENIKANLNLWHISICKGTTKIN